MIDTAKLDELIDAIPEINGVTSFKVSRRWEPSTFPKGEPKYVLARMCINFRIRVWFETWESKWSKDAVRVVCKHLTTDRGGAMVAIEPDAYPEILHLISKFVDLDCNTDPNSIPATCVS